KQKIPLAIHVVNPEMVAIAIEAIRYAQEETKVHLLNRLEHLSLCPESFLEDIAHLQLTVVTNPSLIYDHGDRYLHDVELPFHPWLYRMNSVVEAGIPL